MMNRVMVWMLGIVAVAGCMSKEMKSTPFYEGTQVVYRGEAKDRVNLWPVAYWRNPVGSVAWPVLSFSDDLFALRPLYSQYKQDGVDGAYDEFNLLWPIAQADTQHEDYRVFPVFWGESSVSGESYQTVFPVYWNGPRYNALYPLWYYDRHANAWTFHTFGGLAGARQTKTGYRCSWMFPLWYEDNAGLFSTLVYGESKGSWWIFPFWFEGERAVVSPFYSRCNDGNTSWWGVPALLSWGKHVKWTERNAPSSEWKPEEYEQSKGTVLLGLGGWNNHDFGEGKYHHKGDFDYTWWAWPLAGHDSRMRVTRHGYGNGGAVRERFGTSSSWLLSGLIGWQGEWGDMEESHVYPFYDWEKDVHLFTLLGGWSDDVTWYTPLVGINSEKNKREGGWVFPFWSHSKNRNYEENLAKLDSPTLPDCVHVSVDVRTNKTGQIEGRRTARGPSGRDATTWCLLSDNIRSFDVWGWNDYGAKTNDCKVSFRHRFGNRLLLNYETERDVRYDLVTKAKLSDEDEAEGSFLVWLYQYEFNRDWLKGETYKRHRVLWKLWDWEESAGDVALDIFPGFTYDSKKSGSLKTSFLWRFFRYESDPEKGCEVDLLYLPMWR